MSDEGLLDTELRILFLCVLLQGLNFLIPVIDNIKYVQSLKENAMDIPSQSAITEG